MSALQIQTLLVEDAGISHSGNFIGRAADFTNFLLLGQVGERGSADWVHDRHRGGKHARRGAEEHHCEERKEEWHELLSTLS
jgi:hypothetical protein